MVPNSYGAQLAWEGVLDEIEDYLEQREDIRDGGDGKPLPNEEMRLLSDLRWWRPKTKAQAPVEPGNTPTERKPSAEASGKPGTEARQQLAAEIAAGGNAFIMDAEKRRVIVEALRDGPSRNTTGGDMDFVRELQALINRHSRENASNTPDFILAAYMAACLDNFNSAVTERERWYGRQTTPPATDRQES